MLNRDVVIAEAQRRQDRYIERLAELVGIDSGSTDAAGVTAVAARLAEYASQAGLTVTRLPGPGRGDAVLARRTGDGTTRILLVGHLDTVFAPGAAAERPFRVDDQRIAYGPGVCDDKGGVLTGLAAIETLIALDAERYGEVVLVGMPDEEIGSPGGRGILETLLPTADVALCLECARANGDLVSARKGVTDLEIVLTGRAAHAGIEPEKGANAVLAAAGLTTAIQRLNGRWPGVTTNVGVLEGGTKPNIVAAHARLVCDLRAAETAPYEAALAEIHTLTADPGVPGVTAELTEHAPMPPWEATPATARLVDAAQEVGRHLGLPISATATGGGGDANLIATTGTPVLDGLGPIGGADHTPQEWLDLTSVPPRTALLATLTHHLSTTPPP